MSKRESLLEISAKRLLIGLLDATAALVFALILLSVFVEPAYAYVDPSVMTYTIQALAGVAVALSAVAGVAFRRSRKALMRVLNIDENAKKDVDAPWIRVQPDEANLYLEAGSFAGESDGALGKGGTQDGGKGSAKERGGGLPWPKRFVLSLVVASFCAFTLLIAAPFEIVMGSVSDLAFGVGDIWLVMVLFACFVAVVGALAVSLVRGRAFTVVLVLLFCFGLACYIQAAFLNAGLPEADGRSVDWWGGHLDKMAISAVVWLVILVVPALACLKNAKLSRIAVGALSVALIFVQGVGLASLFANTPTSRQVAITEDGLFEVSSKSNVIVFVLDCYDTKVFEKAVAQDPDSLKEMNGFVWYRNSAGEMIPTNFAMPFLLTGEAPQEGETVPEYLERRYTDSTFLETLHDANYSVGIYTDSFGASYLTESQQHTEIYDNTINLHELGKSMKISGGESIKLLTKCALYRDMPWLLKPRFWFYTDELNQRIVSDVEGSAPADMLYYLDDSRFRSQLGGYGLSVNDRDHDGAFRLIHLLGAHYPYSIDENGWDIGADGSDQMRQARGSLRVVGDYLARLKELGLYDDATIIITSDHGDWYPSMDLPTETTEPILLYKPSGAGGSDGLMRSEAPVSHANFQATVLKAMGLDSSGYEPAYDQIAENDRVERKFFHIRHDQNAHIHGLLEYVIDGDVLDFSNWSFTGREWVTDYSN